jgi:hypothetical protein
MPRSVKAIRNRSLLTAALEGLELQKQRINQQIEEVRTLLGKTSGRRGRPPGSTNSGSTNSAVASKRTGSRLSAAARKRIAAAQKRRWAEYRKSAGGKSA